MNCLYKTKAKNLKNSVYYKDKNILKRVTQINRAGFIRYKIDFVTASNHKILKTFFVMGEYDSSRSFKQIGYYLSNKENFQNSFYFEHDFVFNKEKLSNLNEFVDFLRFCEKIEDNLEFL